VGWNPAVLRVLVALATHPTDATRIAQIEGWLPEALGHYRPR
jgi:hypothetical protein